MASPRLLYYAERAANQKPLPKPSRPIPPDLAPAAGVLNGLGLSLAVWAAIALLVLIVVYQ